MEGETGTAPERKRTRKFKMHWHVVLTHFPVSGFTGAFLFMVLHLVTRDVCMARAAFVTLVLATVVLVPTTLTGWFTWKRNYRGVRSTTFRVKIWTSVEMLVLSVALVVYQFMNPFDLLHITEEPAHLVYFIGLVLLMTGAITEGYWGGKLRHR